MISIVYRENNQKKRYGFFFLADAHTLQGKGGDTMKSILAALALLSGVIGAGFASGREIVRFFAVHGAMAYAAVFCALSALSFLFLRLCTQLSHAGCDSLDALCRVRFGRRLGALCTMLFLTLCAVTGGAMLCACAELGALMLPIHHAYGLTMLLSLVFALLCAHRGLGGLALPGILLCILLPILFVRLLLIKSGEACFLPAMVPDFPVRAAADGVAYGALNAAMLAGMLPTLLGMDTKTRQRSVMLFSLLFGAMLLLGVCVCRRHIPRIYMQAMPFVYLSQDLGSGGFYLLGACMYTAAFSTLCAMLCGMQKLLPLSALNSLLLGALGCVVFACIGFGPLVSSGYPMLGALCAGLLLVLCLPGCPGQRSLPAPTSA